MAGDVIDLQTVSNVIKAAALGGFFPQERTHRVCQFLTAAIAYADVDGQIAFMRPVRDGGRHPRRRICWKQLQVSDQPQFVRTVSKIINQALDYTKQRIKFFGRSAQIIGRKHPERDELNPEVVTPTEKLGDLVRTGLIGQINVSSSAFCPTPITVNNRADVPRQPVSIQAAHQSALIDVVQNGAEPHGQRVRFTAGHGVHRHVMIVSAKVVTELSLVHGPYRSIEPR